MKLRKRMSTDCTYEVDGVSRSAYQRRELVQFTYNEDDEVVDVRVRPIDIGYEEARKAALEFNRRQSELENRKRTK